VLVAPHFVEEMIKKERPDGCFLSFGEQTALNCGIELHKAGVFERYGMRVLGTLISSIIAAEDRQAFCDKLVEIGESWHPRSRPRTRRRRSRPRSASGTRSSCALRTRRRHRCWLLTLPGNRK
jgi:carbamoylphosphate synthase large subunit